MENFALPSKKSRRWGKVKLTPRAGSDSFGYNQIGILL